MTALYVYAICNAGIIYVFSIRTLGEGVYSGVCCLHPQCGGESFAPFEMVGWASHRSSALLRHTYAHILPECARAMRARVCLWLVINGHRSSLAHLMKAERESSRQAGSIEITISERFLVQKLQTVFGGRCYMW